MRKERERLGKSRKGAKPYAVAIHSFSGDRPGQTLFHDWTILRRYRRLPDAEKAFRIEKKRGSYHVQLLGPGGIVFEEHRQPGDAK